MGVRFAFPLLAVVAPWAPLNRAGACAALSLLSLVSFATYEQGCNSSVGSKCNAAGGTCGVGVSLSCATLAPDDSQDCNTNPPNPGGGTCCLKSFDPATAPGCIAVGGTCLFGGVVQCTGPTSTAAQDCNAHGNSGGVCCFASGAPLDASADAAESSAPIATCSSAFDCISLLASQEVPCCTNGVCLPSDPSECTDANVQIVQASQYDQSCSASTDCVSVGEGNACLPGALDCPGAAINESAYAQYQSDVAKTRAASCVTRTRPCVAKYRACCVNSSCVLGPLCGPTPP